MSRGSVVLIDGRYLKVVLKKYFNEPKIDFQRLSSCISDDGESRLVRAYYYYCLPYLPSSPTQEDRERHDATRRFLDRLKMIDRFVVVTGKLELRGYNNAEPVFVQKRIDIALAVTLVKLSYSQSIDTFHLIAGDSDFIPAVEAAKEQGKSVILWHSEDFTYHRDLWQACDERHKIDQKLIDFCKFV